MAESIPSDGQTGWGASFRSWLLGSHNTDGSLVPAAVQAALGGSLLPVFNAGGFSGYDKTGVADSSAAIAAAYASMQDGNGEPEGILFLPAGALIGTPLVFDGHVANAVSSSGTQYDSERKRFTVIAPRLKVAAGIGVALTPKNLICPEFDINFVGGGQWGDVAFFPKAIGGGRARIGGQDFDGTVWKADATTAADNIQGWIEAILDVNNCGSGVDWTLVNAFGFLRAKIWSCTHGDKFTKCTDINGYIDGYYGTGITDGITFDGCNNFNDFLVETGDRPTNSLVRVCSGSAPSNFGRLRLRASVYTLAPPVAVLELDEVVSGDFEVITYGQSGVSGTDWGTLGVRVRGGAVNDVLRIRHHSQTRETTPLKIEAHTTSTPNVRAEVDYRFAKLGGVLIDAGVTGGKLVVEGQMGQMNQSATGATYGVDCQSTAMVVDVSGLEIPALGGLTGAINHVNRNKIRRTRYAQLAGDVNDNDYAVAWTARPEDCSSSAAWSAINQLRGGRVTCRKAGTVKNLYIFVGTASGNISVALYDTKVTTRTQLWTSGAIACPAAGFQKIGDPNITVDELQQLLAVITVDNTTATFLRKAGGMAGSAGNIIPAVLLPSPEGAAVGDAAMSLATSHPAPGTITESAMGVGAILPCIGFQIV